MEKQMTRNMNGCLRLSWKRWGNEGNGIFMFDRTDSERELLGMVYWHLLVFLPPGTLMANVLTQHE